MAKRTDGQKKNRSGALGHFRGSLVMGFTGLTSFGHPAKRIASEYADVASALRNDWIQIGRDMGKVLARKQNGRETGG